MTTSLLLPTSADDLANALFDAMPAAEGRWREPVVRRLAQELSGRRSRGSGGEAMGGDQQSSHLTA